MSTAAKEPAWLDALEDEAWRAFRRLSVAVHSRTAADLATHGLSEADYEVLSTLSERDGHSSPLGVQAQKMGWSRSRLSRHASRMEHRGLLRRDPDAADGRGRLLTLTGAGQQALADVAPHHLASVRKHYVDRLARDDLAAIIRIADRVCSTDPAAG